MAAHKTEARKLYRKIVRQTYRENGVPASASQIAELVEKPHMTVKTVLEGMVKSGEIKGLRGRTAQYLPNDVLVPPIAIRPDRKCGQVMAAADDNFVLMKLMECLSEFYRRKLTMRDLARYAANTRV